MILPGTSHVSRLVVKLDNTVRVEGDEECDAGLLGSEDRDACCDENCKLRENAICSDKNSPCCHMCQYMAVNAKCRTANYATCEKEAECTGKDNCIIRNNDNLHLLLVSGVSASCPKSEHMADGTNCIEKGKCRAGKCIPFCETQGEQSCMCDSSADACKRCCR